MNIIHKIIIFLIILFLLYIIFTKLFSHLFVKFSGGENEIKNAENNLRDDPTEKSLKLYIATYIINKKYGKSPYPTLDNIDKTIIDGYKKHNTNKIVEDLIKNMLELLCEKYNEDFVDVIDQFIFCVKDDEITKTAPKEEKIDSDVIKTKSDEILKDINDQSKPKDINFVKTFQSMSDKEVILTYDDMISKINDISNVLNSFIEMDHGEKIKFYSTYFKFKNLDEIKNHIKEKKEDERSEIEKDLLLKENITFSELSSYNFESYRYDLNSKIEETKKQLEDIEQQIKDVLTFKDTKSFATSLENNSVQVKNNETRRSILADKDKDVSLDKLIGYNKSIITENKKINQEELQQLEKIYYDIKSKCKEINEKLKKCDEVEKLVNDKLSNSVLRVFTPFVEVMLDKLSISTIFEFLSKNKDVIDQHIFKYVLFEACMKHNVLNHSWCNEKCINNIVNRLYDENENQTINNFKTNILKLLKDCNLLIVNDGDAIKYTMTSHITKLFQNIYKHKSKNGRNFSYMNTIYSIYDKLVKDNKLIEASKFIISINPKLLNYNDKKNISQRDNYFPTCKLMYKKLVAIPRSTIKDGVIKDDSITKETVKRIFLKLWFENSIKGNLGASDSVKYLKDKYDILNVKNINEVNYEEYDKAYTYMNEIINKFDDVEKINKFESLQNLVDGREYSFKFFDDLLRDSVVLMVGGNFNEYKLHNVIDELCNEDNDEDGKWKSKRKETYSALSRIKQLLNGLAVFMKGKLEKTSVLTTENIIQSKIKDVDEIKTFFDDVADSGKYDKNDYVIGDINLPDDLMKLKSLINLISDEELIRKLIDELTTKPINKMNCDEIHPL